METIGTRLTVLRKRSGLSQEELADKAGINLRTLQRIEKDECFPRGNTLKLLCDVLEVPVSDLADFGKREDRDFLMWFHLSVCVGLVIPLGSIIIPLILWLSKRDQISCLQEQGANVINFQVQLIALFYVLMTIWLIILPGTMLMYFIIFFRAIAFGIYPLIVAWKIHSGAGLRLFYPQWFQIIR
ncbi:helix-turn-helix domain-containing protein [Coprobacter tertius]|uniref:Helix-turn-helix domain-containing protein n=1 Tax=Coprobacter tertius TaxID=2944915 RepID=A0ABT1MIG2_9BACT|nr:helix-turn-helix domain-containing protein [Coprobacter tertius]MCP9612409.1 helix-turn-helix domain-containing protein [Coprobacter tertius]